MFKLIAKIFYTILLLIESLILIRFILKFIGAPSYNVLAKISYRYSDFFLQPVRGLVGGGFYLGGYFIDTLALVGLFFYMILAFITIELIKAFSL